MKFMLEEGEWGYYIDPTTFRYKRIKEEEDVPNGSFVILKAKEYIEDIARTIVQTTYGYIEKNTFLTSDKRSFSEKLSQACARYILENNDLPPKTTLKKEVKEKKPAYLLYNMSQYDQFHLKLTDSHFNGEEPKEIIDIIIEKSERNLFEDQEQKEEKWLVEYAKSSRAKCKQCGEKIEKDSVRVGKPYYFQEHLNYRWYHEDCVFWRSISQVDGLEKLNDDDRERIEKKMN
ncbi:MAG: PARP-type zinc finger-containing protein [Candidatus Heimdallarchaeaceae archaeon]